MASYRFSEACTKTAKEEADAVAAELRKRGYEVTVDLISGFPRNYAQKPFYHLHADGVTWAEMLPLVVEQIEARAT